jgi:hypothetical protein
MKKFSVPIFISLILGLVDPTGLGIGISRLSAQGGPNPPQPPPPAVIDPPVITGATGSAILPPGSDITFQIVAEGEGRLDYQWFFNGSAIRGAEESSFTIRQAAPDDVGTYYAIVFNGAGSDRSGNMNLILKREGSTGIGFPWVSSFEPLQEGFHRPNDVTTDEAGNVYVVGEVPNGKGDADFVVIKYNKDGREEWSQLLDPSEGQDDTAQSVQLHANGNVIVLGTANTRGGENPNAANNAPRIAVASLSPEGEIVWVEELLLEPNRGAEAVDLALTSDGDILLAGTVLGGQNQDIVAARFNANGRQLWASLFDGGGKDTSGSIATDRSGNALVVGTSFSRSGGDDIIAILYNLRGTEIWNRSPISEGQNDDIGTSALFDSRGRPIVVGAIHNPSSGLDFFVSRYSPGGNVQFTASETSRGEIDDIPVKAVLDNSNSVLIAGNSLRNDPGSEAMILKVDDQGSIIWAHTVDASGKPGDKVNDVVSTSDNGIVIAGGKTNPPLGVDMINGKFDSSGASIWDARFSLIPGESVFDIATAIDIDPRGDVILVGISNSQVDGDGTQVGSNTQLITLKQQITPPSQNTLPVVQIIQPQAGTRYEFEQEVDIIVTATDQEGPIEKIEILVGKTVIGTSTTTPFRATWIVDTIHPVLITARVTDSDGGVVTAGTPIEVIVTDIRPEIVSFPSSQSVTPGATITLVAEVTGRAPLKYLWFQNDQRIKADGPTLVIENFDAKHAGRYNLVVENPAGRDQSERISIELDIPTVIAGDNFADRLSLPGESGRVKVSNLGATRETGEPRHANKRSNHSVWFSYVAGAQGLVEISTLGADFDTLLAVYTGSGLGNLVDVANDEDRGGKLTSQLRFRAEPDQEYIVVVDGFNQNEGTAVLTWNFDRTLVINVPRFSVQPAEHVARPGSQVNFTATFQGPRPANLTLQWFFNGNPFEGETSPQLQVENIGPSKVGKYWAEATLGNLKAESDRATLALAARRAVNALVIPEVKVENKFADLFFSFAGANAQALQQQRRRPIRLAASLATGFSGAQIFNTFGAVKELGEPDHCDIPGGASQWFAYQPPIDGTVGMSTDGSDFDTVMAVYTTGSSDFSSLTEVACDNDSGLDGMDSLVTFDVIANTIYYVAIDGVDAATGVVELTYAMDLSLELNLTATAGDDITAFTYTVVAVPNVDFVIETSEDLITWTTVITDQAGEDGTFQFQDDQFDPSTFERYFRVYYP